MASLHFHPHCISHLYHTNTSLPLSLNRTERTSFNHLMSNMATVPVFGTSFTVYVPIVTILVSLMTVMNVNARVLRFVGVESEDLYIQSNGCTACWRTRTQVALNDEDQERYELGKKLVASELRAEHSSKTSLNTSSHSNKSRNGSRVSLDGSSVRNGSGLSADSSWLGGSERNEAPYRDEEADESISHGSANAGSGDEKGFMCFFTDGMRNGAHKKTCSINSIKNQMNASSSSSSSSGSHTLVPSHSHSQSQIRGSGMTQLSHAEGERERDEVASSMWTKGFVSQIQSAFGIPRHERERNNPRTVPKSTPPLSLSEDIDDMEPQRRIRGMFDREPRGVSASQPHYLSMRSADYPSDSTEGSFLESAKKPNRDEFFKSNSLFAGDKNISSNSNSWNAALNTRQPSAVNDNFGLDEEVMQPHGRRYANI